jgi:hypothetical protein
VEACGTHNLWNKLSSLWAARLFAGAEGLPLPTTLTPPPASASESSSPAVVSSVPPRQLLGRWFALHPCKRLSDELIERDCQTLSGYSHAQHCIVMSYLKLKLAAVQSNVS